MDQVLGALGVIKGHPDQTRLITPYADGMKAISAFLGSATSKLRTIIYADTLSLYYDDVASAKQRGIDVKIIFDHSQAAGAYENPHIKQLLSEGWVDGTDFVIGTSPESGQIVHLKSTWIDDRYVEDGSLNYSPSAFKQINSVSISDWPEYASYLDGIFEQLWQWILENEPQYQVKK
ncbi:phospholipase D-like domain-containing protein [Alicyclobacillus dauci]|uniref:phospholipase D n=1 Tax=Alicyclobacillus dauci TaxID=1475485 RepID=A0ABY6Z2E6_9BACL|nr:phospholipase D-like domain-containing protein [Alicyclobacillus dauci]WAH36778.1 phospholipase D-like domain-containing protein [Alicyclobacillus dauci]